MTLNEKPLESKVQRDIKKKLERAGWKVLKVIQLSENGHPDLLCMRDGVTVLIEVKRPGAEPRPLQQHRINQHVANGFAAFYVDNANDEKIQNMLYNI
jgi:Holliday junction resolvase